MSHNQHRVDLTVEIVGTTKISIAMDGHTYNSVVDQLRLDLNKATDDAIRLIEYLKESK